MEAVWDCDVEAIDIALTILTTPPDKDNNVPAKAPNESLTCAGCIYHQMPAPCANCVRAKRTEDFYCPQEEPGSSTLIIDEKILWTYKKSRP